MRFKGVATILLFTLVCGYACQNGSEKEVGANFNDKDSLPKMGENCSNREVKNFINFLNFRYGDKEELLTAKLGPMTNGNFSEDSTLFMYYYLRVPRVPIQVWVDANSNKVRTVFMEVLSLGENFKIDLATAVNQYKIQQCDQFWFGRTSAEIKDQLGEPTSEVVTKDFVNEITYLSEDGKIMVAFKVYPEQENQCSSVAVTWFYDDVIDG